MPSPQPVFGYVFAGNRICTVELMRQLLRTAKNTYIYDIYIYIYIKYFMFLMRVRLAKVILVPLEQTAKPASQHRENNDSPVDKPCSAD